VGLVGSGRIQGFAQVHAYAAQLAAEKCARAAMEHGVKKVDVLVRGPGSGRETAIRSIAAAGIEVVAIKDVTPLPTTAVAPRNAVGVSNGSLHRTRLSTLSP